MARWLGAGPLSDSAFTIRFEWESDTQRLTLDASSLAEDLSSVRRQRWTHH